MSLLSDDQSRATETSSQLLHTPISKRPSSDADDDDGAVLDVLSERFLLQEVMPAVEQDIHAKHTEPMSNAKHCLVGKKGVAAHVDREKSSVMDEAIGPPSEQQVASTARVELDLRPGAYSHIPVGCFSSRSDDENDDADKVYDIGGAEASENSQEGLVVANLVECHSLEFALPDSKEPERQRKNKTRQYRTFILMSVIFLLAMGTVLLAVLIPSHADTAHNVSPEEVGNSTNPSSQASLEGHVLSLMQEETVNAILDDSNSSQSRAFHWLLDDDHLLGMPDDQIKQRFALATLYFATHGDEWTNNSDWLNYSVSECDWYTRHEFLMHTFFSDLIPGFLSEFLSTTDEPITNCDQHGVYQHLWLDKNNLVGSLPEELYLLTHLQTISMAFNSLQGTISTRIGLLTALEGWGFGFSDVGGMIPTQIGLLTNLRLFFSDSNDHLGTIPTEIWHLATLENLFLNGNPRLGGTIPTGIGSLLNLKWFGIDECGFSGTIPTEMALLQSIRTLSMYRNSFSGIVPSELGLLEKPRYIDLGYNKFIGTIPTELGHLTSLSKFVLRDNHLKGPIPSQLGLLTNMTWSLNLRNNQLTGMIPSELGLLTRLLELELRDNKLTGQIPSELSQAISMSYLSFANNSLSGSVPHELFSLHSSLRTLSLEGNLLLSGILPNAICEINGTCIGNNPRNPCEGPYGFSFSCSILLCGCGCNLCIP